MKTHYHPGAGLGQERQQHEWCGQARAQRTLQPPRTQDWEQVTCGKCIRAASEPSRIQLMQNARTALAARRELFEQVLNEHPLLVPNGYGTTSHQKRQEYIGSDQWKSDREDMYSDRSYEMYEHSLRFLSEVPLLGNAGTTTYGLKHRVEDWCSGLHPRGLYTHNGACIAACLASGVNLTGIPHQLNPALPQWPPYIQSRVATVTEA